MTITWFNGALVDGPLALNAADRGLTLGDGLFETIAVHGKHAVWLDEHVARMAMAAQELTIDFDEASVRRGVAAVLAKSIFKSGVLRITLTRGVVTPRALTGIGHAPSLLITLAAFEAALHQSLTLAVSSIRRNETAPSCRLKTLSYIDNIAAAREVSARADDALMLNMAGNVACTTIGNIFLVRDNELVTPQSDQGILCGITRATFLNAASEIGLLAREAIVTVADVLAADAVFRCNSLRLVSAVTKLDDKPLGTRSLAELLNLITKRTAP
jgi:branched-chain amino acid aminotransferase